MRIILLAAALILGASGLHAQETQVDVTGRTVALQQRAGPLVRGELLAVRGDSGWVLAAGSRRIVAVRLGSLAHATITRHRMSPGTAMIWGLAVGALSGLGLTAACTQVEDTSCGAVFPTMVIGGALWGGVAALSFNSSSKWRFEVVTAEALTAYARFPQGPPGNLDSLLLRRRGDSTLVLRSTDSVLSRP